MRAAGKKKKHPTTEISRKNQRAECSGRFITTCNVLLRWSNPLSSLVVCSQKEAQQRHSAAADPSFNGKMGPNEQLPVLLPKEWHKQRMLLQLPTEFHTASHTASRNVGRRSRSATRKPQKAEAQLNRRPQQSRPAQHQLAHKNELRPRAAQKLKRRPKLKSS